MPYVSLNWLADHVELAPGTDAFKLAADLVRVGLEEERVVPPPVLGPLVVGKVLSLVGQEQKNGKIINYCRVDVGKYNDDPGSGKEASELASRGIVCGAHNFGVGDLVAVVLPGAILPGGFEIAARKTYGHFSDGMICSERELGLSEEGSGILVLTDKFDVEQIPAPGEDLMVLLGLDREILEINITPDRGYCFSMRGIAREYSLATGQAFTDLGKVGDIEAPAGTKPGFAVELRDLEPIRGRVGCDRFVARVVRGVDPNARTPKWMVDRLEDAGMRSISLTVDITNYVMLDLGQPLHAYDLADLVAPLVVRRAREGESFTTLDGAERALHSEDLLITDSPQGDGSRIVGLAGVMGGQYSEVSEKTTDVLVEAAHFDSVSVARSARRHKIPSEAAKRFERGVDTKLQWVAAQRVVDLLVELGGGTEETAATDINQVKPPEPIRMAASEPARLVGVDFTREQVVSILESVGCVVSEGNDDFFEVQVPSWRPDLTGPAHLVEEVARLAGYSEIPSIIPVAPAGTGLTKEQLMRRNVAQTLAARGCTEVLSYPFVGNAHDLQHLNVDDERRNAVRLANPLQEDFPLLRTSILDSLLDTASRNVSRGNENFQIFELGLVTHRQGVAVAELPGADKRPSEPEIAALASGVPVQPLHVGAVLVGQSELSGIISTGRKADWADAIALVQLVTQVCGTKFEVRSADLAPWHPGRCAQLVTQAGTHVAYAGELHPKVCQAYNLPSRSCAVEIDLSTVFASVSDTPLQVESISTFPLAKEDLALVVPVDVRAGDVELAVRKAGGELVEEVRVFDQYTGPQVDEGFKSLAVSLRLRATDRTLTAAETAGVRKRALKQCAKQFGAQLRS